MSLIKKNIILLSETDSTNQYAMRMLASEDPPEGTIIRADSQTNGRGLDTNSWESEKGKNLTFSIILFPEFGVENQFLLNKTVSLGIREYLAKELPDSRVSIKWPNDIYIDDRKACGILIQNSIMGNLFDYVVIGIGLNVNQTAFRSNAPNPVSMKMLTQNHYNLETALIDLVDSIFNKYYQLVNNSAAEIEEAYKSALYRLEQWHLFTIDNEAVRGRIKGTNSYGQLLLEMESGLVKVLDLKEVRFII
jgi:BirA family biotin operon repressor/biotin-[acetyl-CoA-carboxylase] ligase